VNEVHSANPDHSGYHKKKSVFISAISGPYGSIKNADESKKSGLFP
jgi:hypothetical protein